MALHLESPFLQVVIKPEQAFWSVFSRGREGPFIEDASIGVSYRAGRTRFASLGTWQPWENEGPEAADGPHGPARACTLKIGPDRNSLHYSLTFTVLKEHPLLLWRIGVHNHSGRPVRLERLELLRVGYPQRRRTLLFSPGHLSGRPHEFLNYKGAVRAAPDPGELAFFSNGWQSWNFSGAYGPDDRYRRTRLGPLVRPMRVNPGNPHPSRKGHFVSEMFAVLGDRAHRSGILTGFLSQQAHFGSVEAWTDPLRPSLRMWANGDGARLDPGYEIFTDWACLGFLHLDSADPLEPYLEAVARQNGVTAIRPAPTGWCSWYHYFGRVTAQDVQGNLQALQKLRPELPLEVVQIDDGYAARTGDWLEPAPTFPEGVAPLAQGIRRAGYTPGLWMAPFILDPRARLRRENPGWVLRGRLGRPVNAGFQWNTLATALDLTHPEALAHIRQVVHTAVHDWGFAYLKLDHLYAGALAGRRRDPTRTRAQALRAGLEAIREAAGESAFLVGCGCPLGPAIGLVDAMRVGADVDPHWRPTYHGNAFLLRSEPDYPAARNALQNTLARAPMHRRWWVNDPDCLLLDPENPLNLEQVRTLATTLALSGGSLLVSDNMAALPPERLRILAQLLPAIEKRPHVLDWLDRTTPERLQVDLEGPAGNWHLVALYNWQAVPRRMTLLLKDYYLDPQAEYLAHSFWQQTGYRIAGGSLDLGLVPAHSVALLALRRASPARPQYLGSDLHISQGLEVTAWEAHRSGVKLAIERPGKAQGQVWLHLPRPPQNAELDGQPLPWEAAGQDSYRFPVHFDRTARLSVEWTP